MNQNKLLELGCSETEFNFSKLITMEMLFIFLNMCMCVITLLKVSYLQLMPMKMLIKQN